MRNTASQHKDQLILTQHAVKLQLFLYLIQLIFIKIINLFIFKFRNASFYTQLSKNSRDYRNFKSEK